MLTEARCKAAKPGERPDGSPKRLMLRDERGIYLQVDQGAEGVIKSWLYRYSVDGKDRTLGLGAYPEVNLADARRLADGQRAIRAAGKDPLAEKRAARAKLVAHIEAEKTPKHQTKTFGECATAYIEAHKAAWRSPRSEPSWKGTLQTYARKLSPVNVADIMTQDVFEVLNPIWLEHTPTAKNLRSRIELVIDWAIAKKYRPDGDNPASWRRLKFLLPAPDKVAKVEHHAALQYSDVAAFISELAASDAIAAPALQFTVLTAVRTSETRSGKWREVDLAAREWTIPEERMKAGEEHTVPLSDAAFAILLTIKGYQDVEPGDYIFCGPQGRPISDTGMIRLAKKLRPNIKITTHGFRSTFRDWCGDETEFAREVAEAALAHAVGNAVEQTYRRGTALAKRRTLMEAWASHCIGGVVVPFQKRA
jgi:integrase